MADAANTDLKRTALYDIHMAHGGKMVPFAGYEMPVQFEGVKAEHLWTREHAGLFDVAHMGPSFLTLKQGLGREGAHEKIAAIIEQLIPSNIRGLKPGQARLTVLLNKDGGILDDLIVTRSPKANESGALYIVVNGAVKHQDWALMRETFGDSATLIRADENNVLVALQGPEAVDVLSDHMPVAKSLAFMRCRSGMLFGTQIIVSRCGYTGEDGFELLIPVNAAAQIVEKLLADPRVKPIGLGARDSLRLEAGLCLYGQDIDATRTPIEADLAWVIQKVRRERGDFPGAQKILDQLANGPAQKRVGVQPLGRAPAREGTEIQIAGETVGMVTSGGFGPSVEKPVAMGYIAAAHTAPGTKIDLIIRGKAHPAEVCALPFVQANYKR